MDTFKELSKGLGQLRITQSEADCILEAYRRCSEADQERIGVEIVDGVHDGTLNTPEAIYACVLQFSFYYSSGEKVVIGDRVSSSYLGFYEGYVVGFHDHPFVTVEWHSAMFTKPAISPEKVTTLKFAKRR